MTPGWHMPMCGMVRRWRDQLEIEKALRCVAARSGTADGSQRRSFPWPQRPRRRRRRPPPCIGAPRVRVQLHSHALRGLPYVPLASTALRSATRRSDAAVQDHRGSTVTRDQRPQQRLPDRCRRRRQDGAAAAQRRAPDPGAAAGRHAVVADDNPRGRVHRSNVHRDTAAVFDADGDGRQEVAHCWTNARGRSELVLRDGSTGQDQRAIELDGLGDACQIAGIHFAGEARPRLFVAHSARSSDGCWRTYTEYFSRTVVFDALLRKLGSGRPARRGTMPGRSTRIATTATRRPCSWGNTFSSGTARSVASCRDGTATMSTAWRPRTSTLRSRGMRLWPPE